MTPVSTARGLPRIRTWLRALVLLVALLVPGAHTGVHTAPALPVSGETIEYDVLDTVLRPVARSAARAAVPLRPAPRPDPAPGVPEGRPLPAPPGPPYTLLALRTVVLRC
ncbi:hypothetical protein [Streptomyces fulvoviolaceus]|uniref:hypothetical protein n=1 Tax=Streptomyces fulvoviolaceus TaxID=285535 RepID=UPI000693EB07